jgi:hypothetical protein
MLLNLPLGSADAFFGLQRTKMEPKSHHYCPQVYLRAFTSPRFGRVLYQYNVRSGVMEESSPKKSGCADYYHSVTRQDGSRDDSTIEASFASLENKLPDVLQKVRNQLPLSPENWATLFGFITLQRARNPRSVQRCQDFMSKVLTFTYKIAKPELDRKMKAKGLDALCEHEYQITANRDVVLLTSLSVAREGSMLRILPQMHWRFLVASGEAGFVTCDDAVSFRAPDDSRGPINTVGLENSLIELTFPVSRRVCAFASWETPRFPDLYTTVPAEAVSELNRRTVANAWNFVYGPKDDDEIRKLVEERAIRFNQRTT